MAELLGINLAGSIVPFTTEDTFATHLAKFGKGGWRSVADTAERDGITADRREAGMAVYVVAEKKLYILADDLTSWTELGYTKDEIDGLLDAIEAQIDANADAIQKTREDYIQADSDIMTIVNTHAEQITTNKNDIDDLGNQVAEIEAKIPESASETNQLVTQTDLTNKKIEIMGEVNESVSELQTQITAQATELATHRNDIDGLGDQVSAIEEKIPETASAENPLVTRSEISSVYKFKGSVATYNDLPTGATVGDVYNVTDTGANYAWDGSAWDKLSETVDLSSYATTAYVNAREQDIRDDYIQADSELQQQINAHATAITNIEDGVDSINGKIPTNASTTNLLVSTSQLNTEIQDVRADFMTDDAALQTQINGQATTIAGIQDDITGVNSKISASASSTNKLVSASELSATEQDIRADMNETDSQLQTQITAQAGSITTLRNDTDNLGDQVAGIEGKIPTAASSSNQLALNSQITSLQTQITANTNNFTNYRTSAAQDTIDADLQSQITAEQSARQSADTTLQNNITDGLALKLDKDQGSENQGKILSVGSDGQITLTAAPGGGLQVVTHNSTLTGAGTDTNPLGIASSVLSELADKADQTVVDALASTVSSIQTDYTPKATTTALSNTVSGIQSDYVSKTATAAQTIASSLQMPELTVGTAEGTLNLSITAGVATIATNNGLDIISQTKFDTSPTTDDTTTWANALDTNLVRKAQVATAITDAVSNIDALPDQTGNGGKFLATDGTTASWSENLYVGNDYLNDANVFIGDAIINRGSKNNKAISIGANSQARQTLSIAIGFQAISKAIGAIQLGQGSNSTADTLQFKDKTIIKADGTVPYERLSTATPTAGQVLKYDGDSDSLVWGEGGGGSADYTQPLLSTLWSDHLLDDISWLRADTFSWQSGDVYVAAYNHLVEDFENAEVNHWYAWTEIGGGIWYTKTPTVAVGDTVYNDDFSVFGQVGTVYSGTNFTIGANDFNRSASNDITVGDTETIAGIEITYYRAEDGHKICLPDQEDKILSLYNATGVAWYYILDTANKQFKLPRSKHNKYADTVPVVGNGMALGITNGQISRAIGATTVHDSQTTTALMLSRNEPNNMAVGTSVSVTNAGGNDLGTGKAYGVATTPDSSGLIAQQEQDTDQYKYLYFYVGNFERDAVEQTAGVTTETLNSKADVDLSNINASQSAKATIVGWGMPDYTAGVALSDITPSNPYTATIDCVLYGTAFNGTFYINGNIVAYADGTSYSVPVTIKLSKGDTITTTAIRMSRVYMIPLKGAN